VSSDLRVLVPALSAQLKSHMDSGSSGEGALNREDVDLSAMVSGGCSALDCGRTVLERESVMAEEHASRRRKIRAPLCNAIGAQRRLAVGTKALKSALHNQIIASIHSAATSAHQRDFHSVQQHHQNAARLAEELSRLQLRVANISTSSTSPNPSSSWWAVDACVAAIGARTRLRVMCSADKSLHFTIAVVRAMMKDEIPTVAQTILHPALQILPQPAGHRLPSTAVPESEEILRAAALRELARSFVAMMPPGSMAGEGDAWVREAVEMVASMGESVGAYAVDALMVGEPKVRDRWALAMCRSGEESLQGGVEALFETWNDTGGVGGYENGDDDNLDGGDDQRQLRFFAGVARVDDAVWRMKHVGAQLKLVRQVELPLIEAIADEVLNVMEDAIAALWLVDADDRAVESARRSAVLAARWVAARKRNRTGGGGDADAAMMHMDMPPMCTAMRSASMAFALRAALQDRAEEFEYVRLYARGVNRTGGVSADEVGESSGSIFDTQIAKLSLAVDRAHDAIMRAGVDLFLGAVSGESEDPRLLANASEELGAMLSVAAAAMGTRSLQFGRLWRTIARQIDAALLTQVVVPSCAPILLASAAPSPPTFEPPTTTPLRAKPAGPFSNSAAAAERRCVFLRDAAFAAFVLARAPVAARSGIRSGNSERENSSPAAAHFPRLTEAHVLLCALLTTSVDQSTVSKLAQLANQVMGEMSSSAIPNNEGDWVKGAAADELCLFAKTQLNICRLTAQQLAAFTLLTTPL